MQTLIANHWTELVDPNGRTEGAEHDCKPIGRTTISTNWVTQSSQGLNHQPKSIHGGIHGSRYICNRRWPYLASMEGETLGPVKTQCPSVGECEGIRWEWVGEWGSTLVEAGRGDGMGDCGGETRKRDNI